MDSWAGGCEVGQGPYLVVTGVSSPVAASWWRVVMYVAAGSGDSKCVSMQTESSAGMRELKSACMCAAVGWPAAASGGRNECRVRRFRV